MPTARVRLFALARDLAGRETIEVDLPNGARVADLRRAIADACPALAGLLPRLLIAVAGEYASDDLVVRESDELVCFPPVSGGSSTVDQETARMVKAIRQRSVKEEARRLVDQLPEEATWEELMYRIYVREAIEAGLADSEAGRTVDVREVRTRFGLQP